MEITRRFLAALFVAVLGISAMACTAEGEVGEDGAGVQVEGEDEGEGGDD